MSPEVASLLVAVASLLIAVVSLVVAVVATAAAIVAVRRDRADLRATGEEGAAGARFVSIANVGLRPVRVRRLLVRQGRLPRWFGRFLELQSAAVLSGTEQRELPVVVQAADDVVLHYSGHEYSEITDDLAALMFVEDSAGRKFLVRGWDVARMGPPPTNRFEGPTHWDAVGGAPPRS